MELVHGLAPRRLVEAVDVLGHHRVQLPRRLQLRQLQVGGVGLGVGKEHLVAVEAVELLRIFLEKGVAQNGLRRVLVLLVVQPVHAAEVGDSGLRAYPRAAEEHNVTTLTDPVLELLLLLIHGKSFPLLELIIEN